MNKPRSIQSMTGYAAVNREFEGGRLLLELRSVNSRFLDLGFRIPDELRSVEPALRELIMASATRGKVECRISVPRSSAGDRQPVIDRGLLGQVLAVAQDIRSAAPGAAPLSTAVLMRWPGVIVEPVADPEALTREVLAAARQAIGEFIASRTREGERLAQAILERCQRMREMVRVLEAQTPGLLAAFEQKLVELLRNALISAATGTPLPVEEALERVRQEVVLYGLRIDVSEELSRLGVHLDELARIIDTGGAAGKRLDFLMQELNREANTLGSKGANVDLANAAIELKLLIEQIREQVQNIE